MSAGWVAGTTRARAMAAARAGPGRAHELATAPNLSEALRVLATTFYRRGLDLTAGPGRAQRAVSDALLWQLRVLAGWQPRAGAAAVRLLASGFEIANTRDRLRALSGAPEASPYRLGALATAWPRLSRATSPTGLRAVLTASVWGDPGSATPAALLTGMRLSAAARTAAQVPVAAHWAAGDAALVLAREVHLTGHRLTGTAQRDAVRLLGTAAVRAPAFTGFRARLPASARWALEGVEEPEDLWRAEARWWPAVERDAVSMLAGARFDMSPLVGAVGVLTADAWRVRAALECAAHDGGALEAFDELLG
ncbi:V-type ATPase subunit [Streptomyces sp. 351MFTsu5.1]|uniref:V-type ATPase subunit n=1 Tax=Streptomyces sp. 351MFTsu5.1 TaxID=1172180 RepID=UPI00037C7162|nr:V-type ATPase subunit [Streptomyces sp. 351MFTsu5.1]